ncbi:SHOCT domain-containing protein [Chryseobacterium sp. A321]
MQSNYSDLEKLAELRDKGILTETEFNEKKSDILKQKTNSIQPPKKKNTGCLKSLGVLFLIFCGFSLIFSIFEEEKNTTEQAATKIIETDNKEFIVPELDSLINQLENEKYTDDISNVNSIISSLKVFGTMYSKYENHEDLEVQKKVKEFKKAVIDYQVRMLPQMRKTYIDQADEKLWRSNIEVQSMGGSHKTIQLTGAILANNANKEDILKSMREMLDDLRFQRVNMKWYKYDKEFTYFELKNPSDKELYH